MIPTHAMYMLKKCNFCQQPADLMCTRCLEVYCTVECQIRDWADHKKICIPIPKLYPNDSYIDILNGGLATPRKGFSQGDQNSVRMLANNSRSLKPLRKPNIPLGTVELSLNREAISTPLAGQPDEPKPGPSCKIPNIQITAPSSTNEKRSSQVKLDEVLHKPITPPASPEKPASLAQLKLEVLKNHKANKKAEAVGMGNDKPVNSSDQIQQRKPWMLHFPLEKNDGETFEVIVQCMVDGQPNVVWVILATHEAQCEKLLRDIHGQLNTKADPSIEYDGVRVDDIFAAPYEEVYYRVIILEKVDPSKHLVKVRLIDYGNEITIPITDLRAPLPLMKNLRAFAFQIEILKLNRKLALCDILCIRLVRTEGERKVVEIVEQPAAQLLDIVGNGEQKSGAGGIITILTSKTSLIMLTSAQVKPIMKELYSQLPEAATSFPPVVSPKIGDMVCVDAFGVGWSRGLVIETHDKNYLVYTVDNGTIELISKAEMIRILPEEYKRKPRLVLQMDIERIVMNEQEFKNKCYMPSFAFSYDQHGYDKDACMIKGMVKDAEGSRLLAEVVFREFDCELSKIGIRYWPIIPQDKSIVRITSVVDAYTVIVCPHDKINVFTELLQSIVPSLTVLKSAPAVNDIVVGLDDIMMPYRARVLKVNSQDDLQLLDLDNGNIKKIPMGMLYATNAFVLNLPVYTMKIKIRDINPAQISDEAIVIDLLNNLKSEQRKLRLLFEGSSFLSGAKLIDMSTNRSITASVKEEYEKKQREASEALSRKQEEEAKRQEAAAAAVIAEQQRLEQEKKLAAAKAEQERLSREAAAKMEQEEQRKKQEAEKAKSVPKKFMLEDLPMVSLKAGQTDVKLTILDDGDLNHAVLTVTETTPENIKLYATLTDKVNALAAKIGGDGYCPDVSELCVAVFDEDKLWYRAVCLQQADDKASFVVQFIDFGNVASVKPSNIRRLSEELFFPCAANLCRLEDPKSVNVLIQQQQKLGHIVPKEIAADGEIFVLKF